MSADAENNGGPADSEALWNGPHWAFALAVYSRSGVQEACLSLQDRFGVDINVLLVSLYFSRRAPIGGIIRLLPELDRVAAPLRANIVVPLREIRRNMKSSPVAAAPERSEFVRASVKRAELLAEQLEQMAMANFLALRLKSGAPSALVDCTPLIETVVAFYAGTPVPGASDEVATINRAVLAESDARQR